METQGLLDRKNLEQWNTLRNEYEIVIQKEKIINYSAYSENSKAIIYVPHDNLDSASFTHELLHVFLRTKRVFIASGFALSIKGNKRLSRILSEGLIEQAGNCMDHILIYPEFIHLGYPKERFISDYSINKLTDEDLEFINNNFYKQKLFRKTYCASAIDFFIGKYFAAKACPNDSFNYNDQLNKLKTIDPALYQVLETFFSKLKKFDYEDTDPITGSYHTFLLDFTSNLTNWTKGKHIV